MHDASGGLDLHSGAVGDPNRGTVGTDRGGKSELASGDRRVAHRPALFHDERSEHREQGVDRGSGEWRIEYVADSS